MYSDDKVQSSGRINSDQEMDDFLSELNAIDVPPPAEPRSLPMLSRTARCCWPSWLPRRRT
jgi:hypothetical protein